MFFGIVHPVHTNASVRKLSLVLSTRSHSLYSKTTPCQHPRSQSWRQSWLKTHTQVLPASSVPANSMKISDANCCIPVDVHPSGKTKKTQTSTVIVCGTHQVKVCKLEHFKDPELCKIIAVAFPLPHVGTATNDNCSNPTCPTLAHSCLFSVFSVKYQQTKLWSFCSLECCFDRLSTMSDSVISKVIKENTAT